MVFSDESGQVTLTLAVVLALLVISLSSIFFQIQSTRGNYVDNAIEEESYYFYNIREVYSEILDVGSRDKDVSNPFNSDQLKRLEGQLINYASSEGYFLSIKEKDYYPSRDLAKVSFIFEGEDIRYVEEVVYDLG
ncbi:MAG: hypothetical protein BTN85_0613 [Candidatus Methanohalarchaeum thermophilum]|uniref:Uncharacterized protein n=1 Tax=Methanohalarchaeum thermophilum TaxID=1903181 RepID=A0A1Q6DUV9_METT1|nr:MAG: hypothetical protein BTN85_0613 [Candidatus Methanohalarchaeum thermophilum]